MAEVSCFVFRLREIAPFAREIWYNSLPMDILAKRLNKTLGLAAGFLSAEGRRLYFPYGGILGQGAEAKACEINATIGMAFEEDGPPLVMDCFAKNINRDRKAFLYAGSFGLPALRAAWRDFMVRKNPSLKGKTFSNPVVTNALTHGLRVCAELFADKGDKVVVPDLYWDNYALIFGEAVGAKLEMFNTFRNGAFDAAAMKKALLGPGRKKILILNFPNNPTGYTATLADAPKIVAAVKAAAAKGKKIVVVLDDAYFGLVYEKGVHEESLFAEFADLHVSTGAIVELTGTNRTSGVMLRGADTEIAEGTLRNKGTAIGGHVTGGTLTGLTGVYRIGIADGLTVSAPRRTCRSGCWRKGSRNTGTWRRCGTRSPPPGPRRSSWTSGRS